VGQPLRIALVGSRFGPGLYDVILSLDKTEVIKRLKKLNERSCIFQNKKKFNLR
jgi:hypothetical protein